MYIIYTRKSSREGKKDKDGKQVQEYSLSAQQKICLEFAAKNNLPIKNINIPEYIDGGIISESCSAYQPGRPKFNQMVNDLKARKFKGVIVHTFDRISRNDFDSALVKQLINHFGIDFRFVTTSYEKNATGQLHMGIDGLFSKYYSDKISEETRKGNREAISRGRTIGRAPIGYLDKGSDKKPIDPERAPLVRRLFELYASGEYSIDTLHQYAQKRELTVKPMKGQTNLVSRRCVEHILKNPYYYGKIRHKGLVYEGGHVPLIDEALFQKCDLYG